MTPSVGYEMRLLVRGELDPDWSSLFGGLDVEPDADGTTLIRGRLPDQAAVHGLLATVRDLGVSLISIETVAMSEATSKEVGHGCSR